jgi:hypothetical protein
MAETHEFTDAVAIRAERRVQTLNSTINLICQCAVERWDHIPDSTIVGRVLSDGNGYFSANAPMEAFAPFGPVRIGLEPSSFSFSPRPIRACGI